jgi:hypothetical protein
VKRPWTELQGDDSINSRLCLQRVYLNERGSDFMRRFSLIVVILFSLVVLTACLGASGGTTSSESAGPAGGSTGGGITQSDLEGVWYVNSGASNTPFWSRGPISVNDGDASGAVADWQGNASAVSGTLAVNDGIVTNSSSATWQGAGNTGGTVIAATETDGNQAKLHVLTKSGTGSYSANDLNGIWEFYGFESDVDSSGQSAGPWWSRGRMLMYSSGSFSLRLDFWDGTGKTISGYMTIDPFLGTMNVTASGYSQFQCSMDSGKTVIGCTWNRSSVNESGTGIGLIVKVPDSVSVADMAGIWQTQQIAYQGPAWQRGSVTFSSDGSVSAMSLTRSDGQTSTTPPDGKATMNGGDIMTAPWDTSLQCSMDSNKLVMVCTAGDQSDNDSSISVFLR